ncbi:MAG: PhzF family phenazine biosynthesis protein [Polyangiaceae bacterium]
MGLRIVTVDAFTDTPFSGNPAAVCLLPEARDEAWMKNVAREMNLSETAFLRREEGGFLLRWFTPAIEVDLCGHATLASAHMLWEEHVVPKDSDIRFYTRSGLLTATRHGHHIELDFPATPPAPCDPPTGLFLGLGVADSAVYKSRFDYLVELASEEDVRRLTPDHSALRSLGVRGVMVTARGKGPFDVVSRFFAPGAGIDEDPVTGSAHCCIGPYWAERLGKTKMTCYQASARGGVLKVEVAGDRVKLRGQAVTVLRSELLW